MPKHRLLPRIEKGVPNIRQQQPIVPSIMSKSNQRQAMYHLTSYAVGRFTMWLWRKLRFREMSAWDFV